MVETLLPDKQRGRKVSSEEILGLPVELDTLVVLVERQLVAGRLPGHVLRHQSLVGNSRGRQGTPQRNTRRQRLGGQMMARRFGEQLGIRSLGG